MMKHVVILLAFLARAAIADSATCDVHTAAELRTVFVVAIGLNDAFRHATSGSETPEYANLRAQLTDYDERRTLPCAAAAVELLRTSPDLSLGQSLLGLASHRAQSAYFDSRSLPRSLARFLASRPDDFLNALATMPAADRCALVETVETGWPGLKPTMGTAMAEQRTPGENLVANLKRVYCGAASPKPTVRSPGNRTREQPGTERRQSRPRLARAVITISNHLGLFGPTEPSEQT